MTSVDYLDRMKKQNVFSGRDAYDIEWNVPFLQLPEQQGDIESDVRNIIQVYNEQFGNPNLSYDYNPLDYDGNELAPAVCRSWKYPMLLKPGLSKPRPVQSRLMAHEVQHGYNHNVQNRRLTIDFMLYFEDFRELRTRFGKRSYEIRDSIVSGGSYIGSYQSPDEILARLRAYQVFLQDPDAGEPELHEFIEILNPEDLRWLDMDYFKKRIKMEDVIKKFHDDRNLIDYTLYCPPEEATEVDA